MDGRYNKRYLISGILTLSTKLTNEFIMYQQLITRNLAEQSGFKVFFCMLYNAQVKMNEMNANVFLRTHF